MDFQLSLSSEHVGAARPDVPVATTTSATVHSVLALLQAQKQAAVLVCDGEQLVGIFTERDALRLMADGADLTMRVGDAMTEVVATVNAQSTVADCIQMMSQGGYRHLPVVDSAGRPTGVVAVRGIVHYLVEHFPDAVYTQPPTGDRPPAEREGA